MFESYLIFSYLRRSFDTEQRASFPGVDAAKHPPPEPFRKEDNTYHPPDVKFQGESHVKVGTPRRCF